MKILIIVFNFVAFIGFSQTYQSLYSYTKSGVFFEKEKKDSFLTVDTVNINNNENIVLHGKLQTISDDRFTYAQFLVEKTNASPLFKVSDTLIVLIDTDEEVIYDISNNAFRKYTFPSEKELFKDGVLQSIYSNDSLVKLGYQLNEQLISFEENKKLPKNVRGLLLTSHHKWGVNDYKSSTEQMSLIKFDKLEGFSFDDLLIQAKKSCEKELKPKELMFL